VERIIYFKVPYCVDKYSLFFKEVEMRGKCINSNCKKFNQTVQSDSTLCSECSMPLVEFREEPKIRSIGILICIVIGIIGGIILGMIFF
jgi:hypothetical protein